MKKRRPTILIDAWKIALNLNDTQSVQRDFNAPAFNCECELCKRWKASYKALLPGDLHDQLLRSCIDLDYPTELYEYEKNDDGSYIRVQYHLVGKIIDGPQTIQKNEKGRQLFYSKVQNNPLLSIAIMRHRESYEYHPEYKNSKSGEIILVDMRLFLPNEQARECA